MLKLMRISLCFCVLLILQGVCLAQKPKPAKPKKEKAEKLDVMASVVPGRRKQIGQAYISYLAPLNRTWANVDLSEVYNLQNVRLTMTARIDVEGNKVSRPEHITLRLFYPEGTPAFAAPPELSIETDEGWRDFGEMRRDQEERFGLTGPISKAVAKEIEFDAFERIARSNLISMRVGKIEFRLNEKQLNALRDLLSAVGVKP